MKPDWKLRIDPEHQPVRFLEQLWRQRMEVNFGVIEMPWTPRQMGQLRMLMKHLGNLTQDVLEWMLSPKNWWDFSQEVKAEAKLHDAPPRPHIGFLLRHHTRALRIMRSHLCNSIAMADVSFVHRLDLLRYQQMKALVLVYAAGNPERLARVQEAKTLLEMQQVFVEILNEDAA